MPARIRPWPAAVAALAVTGVALRAVVVAGPWGTVDSDEAVVGLMAEGFRRGEWQAFYWGQHYAGTQETALVALAGASVAALKLVPILLSAVAAVLTWRVGRRLVEERLAQAAGLLTWVGPGAFVWWSTKERGFYWASLVLGLLLVLAAQRIVEGEGRPLDWAGFGLAAGLGFWASPTVLYFAVPAGLWLLVRRPPLRWASLAVPSAALGALPWLWHNVGHGFPSLDRPSQPESVGYLAGIGRLLWRTTPIALNLRLPIEERWVVPVVAPLLLVALAAVVVWRRPPLLLGLALAAFPFIYAWFPGAWFVGEARYALFASPFLALAVSRAVGRPAAVLGVAAVSAAVSLGALGSIEGERPEHLGGDIAALERAGVDTVWADYWIAYRLGFESDGRVVASSSVSSRTNRVRDVVAADPTPAILYERGDPRLERLVATLRAPHRRVATPHFVVVLVDGPLDRTGLPVGLVP